MKVTVDDLDVFKRSGPTHLCSNGDPWSHPSSARAAMACLVQAVYALDKDRSLLNMDIGPLARDWHLPFKYKVVKLVHDDEDNSVGGDVGSGHGHGHGVDQQDELSKPIVGAVFKWSRILSVRRPSMAPKVVVAFRGTILQGDTRRSDLLADWSLVMLQLHKTPRFRAAKAAIEEAIQRYGHEKVWITGHSLGAAVCLMVGRSLAESKGCLLQAHLFNPPFPGLPSDTVGFKALYSLAGFVVKVAHAAQAEEDMATHLPAISSLVNWRPNLYVNVHDPICCSYISYFQKLQSALQAVSSSYNQNAIKNPGTTTTLSSIGGWSDVSSGMVSLRALISQSSIPFHHLPSAHLYFPSEAGKSHGFMDAHGMKQWWSQDSNIQGQPVGLASLLSL